MSPLDITLDFVATVLMLPVLIGCMKAEINGKRNDWLSLGCVLAVAFLIWRIWA